VIRSRATATDRPLALTDSGTMLAKPSRSNPASNSALNPCASMTASVQPRGSAFVEQLEPHTAPLRPSAQFGRASAPMILQLVHTMRGPR
jgi:hypothetical protein